MFTYTINLDNHEKVKVDHKFNKSLIAHIIDIKYFNNNLYNAINFLTKQYPNCNYLYETTIRYPQVCGRLANNKCFICKKTTEKKICIILPCCSTLVHINCFKKFYTDKRKYIWKFPQKLTDSVRFRLLTNDEEEYYQKNINDYDFPECICEKELHNEFEYIYDGQNWVITKYDTGEERVPYLGRYMLYDIKKLFRNPTIKNSGYIFKRYRDHWSVFDYNTKTEKKLDYRRDYNLFDLAKLFSTTKASFIDKIEVSFIDPEYGIRVTDTHYTKWREVWDELTQS